MNVNGNDITIEIGASAKAAAENINAVSTSIKNLKTSASGGIRGLSSFSKRLTELGNAASTLNASSKALGTITELFKTIGNLGQAKIPKSLSANISSIANAVKDVSPEALKNLDKMASSLQKLSGVDLKGFKDVASQSSVASVQAKMSAATSSHIPSIGGDATKYERELNKIDRAIERTQRKIAKFKQALAMERATEGGGEAGNVQALNAAIAEQSELLNRLIAQRKELTSGKPAKLKIDSSDADKATRKMSALQKVFSSFKRIAFYRAIRSAIRFVTDGFKEGLENAYQFSKGVGGPLSSALDNLSSAGFKMKNQLGAAFGQLLVAVTPILLKLIDIVTAAANAVTQFFALLSGQSTYLKAKNYWKEWGDAASGAGSAAKEALKYLAPFDELNVLPSASSSGGGGGTSLTDYENMFAVTELDNWAKKLQPTISWIKDNFDSILQVAEAIGLTILAWKVSRAFSATIASLLGLKSTGLVVGLTLLITGIALEGSGIAGALKDGLGGVDFAKILGGGTAITIGGAKLGGLFGSSFLGGATGAIVAGLPAFFLGIYDASVNGINWLNGLLIPVAGTAAGAGIGALIGSVGGPLGALIGAAVGLVADGVILMVQNEDIIREETSTLFFETIPRIWNDFVIWISNKWNEFTNWWHGLSIGSFKFDLIEKITTKWNDFTTWISNKWNSLKTWWQNLSLGEFKIKTPHISWTSTPASGWIANVLSTLGLPTSLPKLNVSWYARGGIVDKASLIGAGEAGKEAIVPLERNTQWVRMVASQLANQLGNQNSGGYNVDLADDLEDANGVVVNAILAATAEIVRAMSRNSGNGQNNSIDIDAVARRVTRWQNNRARAAGI